MLNIFAWFRGRSKVARTATELYGSIVTQARQPTFYSQYGVPDVAEKRYEMIVLHIVLVLERLRASGSVGAEASQELVEVFVRDLDGSIREMAVGDTKVPTNVKKAAAGLLDRDLLYRQVFDAEAMDAVPLAGETDEMTLDGLLAELVFDGDHSSGARALLQYTHASRQALGSWKIADGAGKIAFARPEKFLTEGKNGSGGGS